MSTQNQPASRDNIPLTSARTRLRLALFSDAPNAYSYSDSDLFRQLLQQTGYSVTGEAVDAAILEEPELARQPQDRVVRAMQLLAQETNRGPASYVSRGGSRGFSHGLTVDPDVIDGIIALARRKLEEKGTPLVLEPVTGEAPPLPKTVNTLLEQKGGMFINILVDTLGLAAPPIPAKELLGVLVDGLVEAGAISDRGNTNKSGGLFNNRVASAFADLGDGLEDKQKVMRSVARQLTFARVNGSAGISPELAAIGPREMQVFAEIIRDRAPKTVAQLKHRIQVGGMNWEAAPEPSHILKEPPTIKLRPRGKVMAPVHTRIPFTEENVARVFQAIQEEVAGLQQEEPLSDRVVTAKVKTAAGGIESAFIGK